jgi:hypothetical protein
MDKTQNLLLLEQVVCIVTTRPYTVKRHHDFFLTAFQLMIIVLALTRSELKRETKDVIVELCTPNKALLGEVNGKKGGTRV